MRYGDNRVLVTTWLNKKEACETMKLAPIGIDLSSG